MGRAIAAHQGRIVSAPETPFQSLFRSAIDAVRAIAVQTASSSATPAERPGARLYRRQFLEIKPLRNRLGVDKPRQSELIQTNIGEAGNGTTAAITRPAQGQSPYVPGGLRGQGQIERAHKFEL